MRLGGGWRQRGPMGGRGAGAAAAVAQHITILYVCTFCTCHGPAIPLSELSDGKLELISTAAYHSQS